MPARRVPAAGPRHQKVAAGSVAPRWAALAVALSLAWPAAAAPWVARTPQEELIAAAMLWSGKNRNDLARPLLDKALALQADDPVALALLGELDLRERHPERAQQRYAVLRQQHPQAPATQALAQMIQAYGPDAGRLSQMRLMARAGRKAEAAALARQLFPAGAPAVGSLGLEVAALLGERPPMLLGPAPTTPAIRLATGSAAAGASVSAPATPPAARTGARARRATTAPRVATRPAAPPPTAVAAPAPAAPAADPVETLRAQATALSEHGQVAQALATLTPALDLAPRDPWLRHQLARLQLRLQQPEAAHRVMDEGVALAPHDEDMRFARGLIREALDDDAGALDDLAMVPPAQRSAGMQALEQRVRVHQAVAQGRLGEAEHLAGDDAGLLDAVSEGWFRTGQPAAAVAVQQRALDRRSAAGQSVPPAQRLALARVQHRAGDDAAVAQALPGLLAQSDWPADEARQLAALEADHVERQIEQLALQGDTAQAEALAQTPPHDADPAQARRTQARWRMAAGDAAAAVPLLQAALATAPDDTALHLALGNAWARLGDADRASEQARWLAGHLSPQALDDQLALLRLWQRAGQTDEAQALSATLRAQHPTDADVLSHAARLARSRGQYDQALALFTQARPAPGAAADAKLERDIAALQARGQAWIETGTQWLHKNATEGVSSLRGLEQPVVLWWPQDLQGRWFLHLDPLHLSAGTLDPANTDLGQLPAPHAPLTGPVAQTANGANVGVGYQTDDWRADLGVIGANTLVPHWVGGVRWQGNLGLQDQVSYALGLSRRPLTGSLLSYLGQRDPVSGQVWGGVVATGAEGRIATDWGPYSVSLSGDAARLTGLRVQSNSRVRLRAAVDRDLWRTPNQGLNLGLALSVWHHARTLSEYSWGQGGYYSPGQYQSVALPLTWDGREGPWSWKARATLSYSHTRSTASPTFPTDPTLQTVHNILYAGGTSQGVGRSLRAALEYAATPHWAVGAALDVDRSDGYAPTQLTVYLRYLFSPVVAPHPERPRPVEPYSSF
ncbi:BCSC C-terminal domain-containing protein [Ideonella sp. B7]|uniref:cellulose biosynthesis protein BcsC n=1 Tax=Ideonella benzenivorans TaxID=2831643 RepID=UPI001CECE7D2|nr:cellulose biosynthesis protein BcsC [Ideonella benzenivorans]MCA6216242.1 BCSC C-terminal domain-containing protein [Ideonella benzenivorans]